jgi:beta-lactam-binding protein with PASTA domain
VAVAVAALVLIATAALAGGLLGDREGRLAPPRSAPSVATSVTPTLTPSERPASPPGHAGAILVPSVAGLRPFDAVTVLASLGLEVAEAIAVPGKPGLVVATDPEAGTSIEPGSAVTLLVGAPADRRSATPT